MLSDLISMIFPQNCINCQQSLISDEKYICTACKLDLPYTKDHDNHDNELIRKFVFEEKVSTASSFLYFYRGGIAQKILHQLKYQGKMEIGELMGTWYGHDLSVLDIDFIIPVPLHKSKLRKRGYNQSESFATGLAKVLEKEVNNSLIKRNMATMTQTKKSKVERWKNLDNVYSDVEEDLTGRSVLVVDDVITTGATIGMLCSRLVEANVKTIHIACIARGK
jgi:ComF family protein